MHGVLKEKVTYHPIEAAIRWSGQLHLEHEIISELGKNNRLNPRDVPCTPPLYPQIYLHLEKIYDGLMHNELPYYRNGTNDNTIDIDDPELTIRHIHLKQWMKKYYPNERPDFLFAEHEQNLREEISLDSLVVLLAECEALRTERKLLRTQHKNLETQLLEIKNAPCERCTTSENKPDERAEKTYLTIIGAMLALIQKRACDESRAINFKTQDALVKTILEEFPHYPGLSERTLNGKFSAARKIITNCN